MDEDEHSASSKDSSLRLKNAIIALEKARSSAMENEKRQNELLFSACTNLTRSLDSMLPKLERAVARRTNAMKPDASPASPVTEVTVEHNIIASSNDTIAVDPDAVEGPNETEEHNSDDTAASH